MHTIILKVTTVALLLSGTSSAQEITQLSMADAERVALENHPAARSARWQP